MASPKYAYLSFQGGVDYKDVNPTLLRKVNALGRAAGKMITITSGFRSIKEQQYLWDNAAKLGLVRGVTVAKPGSSDHQHGTAVDAVVDGKPIGQVFSRDAFIAQGLKYLPRDMVHVTFLSSKEGGSFTPGGGGGDTTVADQQSAPVDTAPTTDAPTVDPADQQRQALLSQDFSNIDQVPGAPLAQAGGIEMDEHLLPQNETATTWQLIADNGNVSQDTIRLAQQAQLSNAAPR